MTIGLGDKVKDRVTGFTGTVTSYTKWLTGRNTAGVQPEVDKDGKVPDSLSFDLARLDVLESAEKREAKRPKSGMAAG